MGTHIDYWFDEPDKPLPPDEVDRMAAREDRHKTELWDIGAELTWAYIHADPKPTDDHVQFMFPPEDLRPALRDVAKRAWRELMIEKGPNGATRLAVAERAARYYAEETDDGTTQG